MRSQSFQVNSVQDLNVELEKLGAKDFRPTIGFVFCSVSYSLEEIGQVFTTHKIDLVGSTSAGEIYDKEIFQSSIVVLLMDMKKEHYSINFQKTASDTTYQIAYSAGLAAKEEFTNPAIIVVSGGLSVDGDQVIYGIKDGVGREIPLFGGMAGDDLATNKTYVFTNNQVTSDGLLCFMLDSDKIEVKGMASCGWEAIGSTNIITEAQGNILKSINGEPALDVFMRYFGFFDNANKMEENQMGTISGQYPLQIQRENGTAILRSPLMVNEEDRSLILAGSVKEGDKFRFSIAPGFEVIENTVKEFSDFQKGATKVDAMLLFSCKGRHTALGPLVEQEVEGIHDYWNAPMIGFFAYGEIGQAKEGVCEFHNETCSLVTFYEK